MDCTQDRAACYPTCAYLRSASWQSTVRIQPRDHPHKTWWEQGANTAELSAWKLGGPWAKDACAIWILPLVNKHYNGVFLFVTGSSVPEGRMACALSMSCYFYICFMLFLFWLLPLFIFLVTLQTLTWRQLSMYFMVLSLTLAMYKHVLLQLGSHLQNPGNSSGAKSINLIFQIDRKRDISTHSEHSLWSLGPAFSSSVHW